LSEAEDNKLALRKAAMEVADSTEWGEKGAHLTTYAQAKLWAQDISRSGLAPKGMSTPEQILVAVQTGAELGFSPMRALQSVVVVNGAATLRSTTITALIQGSGLLEPGTSLEVGCEERDGVLTGYCRTQRRGAPQVETTFTQEEAKKAGLWGKSGPWSSYPKRMLMHRAIGFHGRDHWGDVCHGLPITDEAIESRPPARDVTPSPANRPAPKRADPLFGSAVSGDSTAPDAPKGGSVSPIGENPHDDDVIDIDPETGEIVGEIDPEPTEEEIHAEPDDIDAVFFGEEERGDG
jgi:hypothetical protein